MPRPRKPKPMKWAVLVGRRRMNVPEFFRSAKIRSYKALVTWCEENNVEPPSSDEMRGQFGVKRASPPKQVKTVKKAPKKASKAPKEKEGQV